MLPCPPATNNSTSCCPSAGVSLATCPRKHRRLPRSNSGRRRQPLLRCRRVRRSYRFYRRYGMTTRLHEKITIRHRERHAYIYVRQSTFYQVHQRIESQRNQYALVQRVIDLGWPVFRVHVIDADLGQSGQDSQRPGFQELVAAVSLGRVGIILAYEASRLARNNADWYTLIDLATVMGTLLADTEGVYDPRQYNDRLL